MANRFFDTNYYKSPFVRSLKGALKSLYSFIICDCNGAGIWNIDLQAASLYIGFEISMEEFEAHFIMTGKAYPVGGQKFFFPDFIEHQYPNGLKANNPAHKNFISILKKHDLLDVNLKVTLRGAEKGLPSPIGLGLSNGNGQGNGNTIEFSGNVCYDAEAEILKSQTEFERICMVTRKDVESAKESLHKYHLFLTEKEQYPKGRKAVFAGFEKWLLNEKTHSNGTTKGNKTAGRSIEFDKP